MSIDEINAHLDGPNAIRDKHQRKILEDVKLLMQLGGHKDSSEVNPAAMVAVIQKEIIAD